MNKPTPPTPLIGVFETHKDLGIEAKIGLVSLKILTDSGGSKLTADIFPCRGKAALLMKYRTCWRNCIIFCIAKC